VCGANEQRRPASAGKGFHPHERRRALLLRFPSYAIGSAVHPSADHDERIRALAVPPVGRVYENRESDQTIMNRRNHPHACWPYTERPGTLPILFMIEPSIATAATIKLAPTAPRSSGSLAADSRFSRTGDSLWSIPITRWPSRLRGNDWLTSSQRYRTFSSNNSPLRGPSIEHSRPAHNSSEIEDITRPCSLHGMK